MKELREPWVHWISSVQRTLKGTLRSNHVLWKQKLLGESLRNIQEADRLEHIIVKGVNKWCVYTLWILICEPANKNAQSGSRHVVSKTSRKISFPERTNGCPTSY